MKPFTYFVIVTGVTGMNTKESTTSSLSGARFQQVFETLEHWD